MSASNTIKNTLRPLARKIRGIESDVVPYRKHTLPWADQRNAKPLDSISGTDFKLLWQDFPPPFRKVEVDGAFNERTTNYAGSHRLTDLVQVLDASGSIFLSVSLCEATGVVLHRRLPSPDWLFNYYASEWDSGTSDMLKSAGEILAKRPDKVNKLLRNYGVDVGQKILDVGCGYGDQLWYFKQSGREVWGIEPSVHRAQQANAMLGGNVENNEVEGVDFTQVFQPDQRFDLIYLNQVLEHLHNPLEVLKSLRGLLNKGGKLLIGVPSLFSEAVSFFSFSITHSHSFSSNALRNLLALGGFRFVQDLSFPAYCYMVFEPTDQNVPLVPTESARIKCYFGGYFDLVSGSSGGRVIDLHSDYLGEMSIGLQSLTQISVRDREALARATSTGKPDPAMDRLFPIRLHTEHTTPVIWHK